MPKLGEAFVVIRASLAPLRKGLKAARQAVTKAMGKIRAAISRMSNAIVRAAKIAGLALVALSGVTVKLAMDAEESENLFTVSMGKMAASTRRWSNEISKALGLNQFEVRKMVSTFNVMLNSMGLTEKEAAAMSQELTQLAFDMASFFNLKPDEAFLKLQAGITGEIEPLKRLGILVNEATIKNFALTKGMIKQKGVLTEIQKVQARFGTIMKQTNKAQGDLARTLASSTNVFRTIKSVITELSIQIGNIFLPLVNKLAIEFRDFVVGNTDAIKDWAKGLAFNFAFAIGTIRRVGSTLAKVFGGIAKNLTDLESPGDAFKALIVDMDEALERGIPTLTKWGTILGGTIKTGVTNAINWFRDLLAIIKDEGWSAALSAIGFDIREALKVTFTKLKPFAEEAGLSMAVGFGKGIIVVIKRIPGLLRDLIFLIKDVIVGLIVETTSLALQQAQASVRTNKLIFEARERGLDPLAETFRRQKELGIEGISRVDRLSEEGRAKMDELARALKDNTRALNSMETEQ